MSIGGLQREVLTVFKADTSELEAGHKRLQHETEESKKGVLGFAQSMNEGLNDGIEWLGKFNQAFEGAHKIVEFATEAMKEYAQFTKLTAAAGTADMEKLSEAAGGLRTETELLTFAAKAQHGIIRASQADMETAERAMRALTAAGFDQADVSAKVQEAMVSLKTRGLKELGIEVQKGSTDLETYNNMMDALAKKASGVDDATLSTSEKVQHMGVEFHDAFEKMRISVGQMVISMAPLIESVAKITGGIGKLLQEHPGLLAGGFQGMDVAGGSMVGDVWDYIKTLNPNGGATSVKVNEQLASFQTGFNRGRNGSAFEPMQSALDGLGAGSAMFGEAMSSAEFNKALKEWEDHAKADYKKAQEAANKLAEERKKLADKVAKELTDALVKNLEGNSNTPDSERKGYVNGLNDIFPDYEKHIKEWQDAVAKMQDQLHEITTRDQRYSDYKDKTYLEKTFGSVDEFDSYANAFNALSGAIGSSYQAIVEGTEPAGKAIKKFFADQLMAMGTAEAAQAIKEEAWALGEFAWGDVPKGVMHQLSALKHAAAAVAAGVAAHELGTSAQVAASDKAAADKAKEAEKAEKANDKHAGGGGSSGGSGSRGRDVIVAYLDPFANMTYAERGRASRELVQKTLGQSPAGRDS